jgi:RNA polymerase sigma factor (sigma-70 family)
MGFPDRKEEVRLWRKCLSGDREAWDTLVSNYSRFVCLTIRLKLIVSSYRSIIDCRDIYQKVFLLILQKINQWRSKASLRAYIRKIASNVTMDHIRKIRREQFRRITLADTPEEEDDRDILDTLPHPINNPDRIMYQILLKELPQNFTLNERYLLELHYQQDWSFEEIARHLHKDVGAIHTMHSRIRSKLKRVSKNYFDSEKTNLTIPSKNG